MARSYLYVPGDRPDFLAKSLGRGADALIVDLEDSVRPDAKSEARRTVRRWLEELPADHGVAVWVRVNSGAEAQDDLAVLADAPNLTGVCAAKTESAADIVAIAQALDAAGASAAIMPLLESARSVLDAQAIAAAPRVTILQIGEADLAVDVGIDPSPLAEEFAWARSAVVFASASAGLAAPVGPVSTNFRDPDLLTNSTEALRRMGFFGRACIHPAQIAVTNEIFTVPAERAERAHAVLERQRELGTVTFVGPDGTMVDEAVLRAARRIVAQTQH